MKRLQQKYIPRSKEYQAPNCPGKSGMFCMQYRDFEGDLEG